MIACLNIDTIVKCQVTCFLSLFLKTIVEQIVCQVNVCILLILKMFIEIYGGIPKSEIPGIGAETVPSTKRSE